MAKESKTYYGDDIKACQKALEFCKKGHCESAIPFIVQRLNFMYDNDFELYPGWPFA